MASLKIVKGIQLLFIGYSPFRVLLVKTEEANFIEERPVNFSNYFLLT